MSPLSLTSRISEQEMQGFSSIPKGLNEDSAKKLEKANFLPTEDDLEQWRRMGDINLNDSGA